MQSLRLAAKTAGFIVGAALASMLSGSAQVAHSSSPDPGLESWAGRRIVERPGLPPRETRSPGKTEATDDPVAVVQALRKVHVAGFPKRTEATEAPRRLDARPDDLVYATTFLAPDGSTQEFAAHLRPDDARPLYLRASGYEAVAGAGFAQAQAALIKRVLGGSTQGVRVSALASLFSVDDLSLRAGRHAVQPPWGRCWVFFVDDHPLSEWQHPCRYVFLAEDLSAFAVQYGRSLLEAFATNGERVLFTPTVDHPMIDDVPVVAPARSALPASTPTAKAALDYTGSAQNCYAVIISGGANAFNNWQRYWEDSANIYSTLTRKYGFTDDHIIALVSDGTNAGNDRNVGTRDDPVYVNSSTDLDGDGDADTDGPCTLAEVQSAFDDLADILTANDQLFVFITDHGYQESGWDAGVNLWNWEELRDDQLADMTSALPCPVIIAMETCYSGGFVDDLTATANRVIGTACAYNDTSEGWSHYDPWVYYFTASVRGFYPAAFPASPWTDGSACDVDSNGDHRISFNEAWTHAWNNRPDSDVPKLGENPAGLGNSLFMNHRHIQLYHNSPVSYSQIPKDFSFQVRADGWAGVGVASASDHDLKADNNRQLTSAYRTSTYSGSTRDFVVVNGHRVGNATHYAQVYFGAASAYTVEAESQPVNAILGSAHSYTASATEVFDLIEANLVAGISYDVTLEVTAGNPDLGVYVYSTTVNDGSRGSANWSRNTGGAGGDETLTFRPTTSGYYGLVMVNENGGSGNYTITIEESPPLAAPTGVAATDGTYTDRIRVTWNSVAGATHYRVYRNTVNNSGSASALNDWTAGTTYDDLAATAGRTYYYWVKAAATSEGDRESAFSAANSGYVLPPALVSDSKVTTSSNPTYYRAGGESSCTWWWAVGVRYDVAGENWSLRLYSTPGFGSVLESSSWNTPVDFVVVDGNHVGAASRGVEAYRAAGGGGASVEFEGTGETLAIGASSFNWTAGDVVEIWDVALTAGTTYRFTLDITSGANNLGFALYGSGDGDYQRAREHFLARSDSGGSGGDESFTVTATGTDDYGLCVWANSTEATSYTIRIETLAAGLWEGDVSTDWHTPGNWNDGYVPDAADDVTIPTGAPRYPVVASANAACSSLTLGAGAALTVNNRHLDISGDFTARGALTLQSSTACQLRVGGSVFWEEDSTCTVTGSSEMYITGDWNFEDGANVQLAGGYVEFEGTGPSWIRVYDGDCRFYNVRCDKTGGGYVGLSALCVAPIHVNNLYQYSASSLRSYASEPLIIDGFFNNLGGHFQFLNGSLVYEGSPGVGLKPNTGDYLNNLVIAGPGTLVLDATYTNHVTIRGNLEIAAGGLNASSMDLAVGGSWTNTVGTAGFNAGTRKVAFHGVSSNQRVTGTNVFYDLEDNRSGGGQLLLYDHVTVQHDFTVHYQTAAWAPLVVQGTLDISDPVCQLILWGASDVQASILDLGGRLLVYTGSLVAGDLVNNGIYGYLHLQGGQVALTQGTTTGEYFDLYGTIKMSGGRLDLIGGRGDHYWPLTGACTFEMNGGVLDFHNQGWQIRNGFSGGITNGTLRCAENVISLTPAFAPEGGLLELYGPLSGQLRQVAGSTFPSLLVNKSGSARADVVTNLTLTGDVEIRAGNLKANTNVLSVAGSWSNHVGTAGFSEDTSTIRFVGGTSAAVDSDETFYRLEVAKTYAGFAGLETERTIHVLNDLVLTDGTLELNSGSLLDVDRDVLIALGAGLNANDAGAVEIHVGRHWADQNTGFASTYGFDPGYSSLVVFDGGAVAGDLSTAATVETFDTVRIDRPGGTLRVLDALLLRDDLTILNGSLSYAGGPFTHRLRGDLVIEPGGAWHETACTVIFDGTSEQILNHQSMDGWFKHMIVERNTGIGIVPLTLRSDVLLLNGGTLTVREGYLDLNGHYIRCTGNVTVEDGGKLLVGAGAELEVGQTTLDIQGGGLLDVRGRADHPATVQAWNGQIGLRFAFLVRSNAVLRAEHAVFEHLDAGGLQVLDGATVEEPFTFHGCTFRNGTLGGTLLALENNQKLTIQNAVFPNNPGGRSSNVRKSSDRGAASFVHATGVFAGELYDDDSFNLIDWHTGGFTVVNLTGPTMATLGGQYDYTATVTGDLPLTPITYFWSMTDHSPTTRTHGNLTDALADCQWMSAGGKTVQVTASNAAHSVQASLTVDVRALEMALLGRQWVGTTNAVSALLQGTCAASTYQVQYCTNLTAGMWTNALPDGVLIPGQDGETPWLDMGGPGRDVTTAPQLFYRAVLPAP